MWCYYVVRIKKIYGLNYLYFFWYLGLEFAYSQAPDFMQGLCMGLFLMMSGLGNYVSEAILKIVRSATGSEPPGKKLPLRLYWKSPQLILLHFGL